MRKKKKARSRKQRYNIEMIEDFLDHFFWEFTINLYECTRQDPDKQINPELVEQLYKYQKKYNTIGLMPALVIDPSGVPEGYAKEATKSFRIARAEKAKEVLAALETLKPYFVEAFARAMSPDHFVVTPIKLSDTIETGPDDDQA